MQRRGWKTAIQQLFTQIYPWSPSINPDWPRVPCTQQRGWKTAIQQRFTQSYPSINPDYYPRCHVGDDMDGHQLSDHPPHPPHRTTSKSNNKQSIQTQGGMQATTWVEESHPTKLFIKSIIHYQFLLTQGGMQATTWMEGTHLNDLTLCNMGGWTPAIQQQPSNSSLY